MDLFIFTSSLAVLEKHVVYIQCIVTSNLWHLFYSVRLNGWTITCWYFFRGVIIFKQRFAITPTILSLTVLCCPCRRCELYRHYRNCGMNADWILVTPHAFCSFTCHSVAAVHSSNIDVIIDDVSKEWVSLIVFRRHLVGLGIMHHVATVTRFTIKACSQGQEHPAVLCNNISNSVIGAFLLTL